MQLPNACITALDAKFSEAMSSMPSYCRSHSRFMMPHTSGSASLSDGSPRPGTGTARAVDVTGGEAAVVAKRANADGVRRRPRAWSSALPLANGTVPADSSARLKKPEKKPVDRPASSNTITAHRRTVGRGIWS